MGREREKIDPEAWLRAQEADLRGLKAGVRPLHDGRPCATTSSSNIPSKLTP